MKFNPNLAAAFLLLCALVLPLQTYAQSTSAHPYMRLFYYKGGARARTSFLNHPDSIDIFAPQTYAFDDNGGLTGKVDPILLTFAKAHGIKVMPLVTNNGFSQTAYQTILDDPAKQAVAIQELVGEAKQYGYWGWQIDFEQMDASYRDKFSAFIQNADAAMKQNNLTFSVAVVAKVSDNPSDYPNNLWQNLIGVYDYSAVASSTDFVSVMSYDDPNSTGPVVEYSWLQNVLSYSLSRIPNSKLSLGIPFYYWQWSDATGKRVGIGGDLGIQRVLNRHKVVMHYDAAQQAPYMTYWSRAKSFTIWYENAKSIAQKVSLVTQNQLYGFSGWALGLELPSMYASIQE
jgi:spore germination protein YaaH